MPTRHQNQRLRRKGQDDPFSLFLPAVRSPARSMLPQSPYHYLNLRRNPFGELTREERAELAIVDVEPWREYLSDHRAVLQFLGPCGHGKTTHLLAIERAIPGMDYVYLPEVGPRPAIPANRPMIVDESQRLSWWQLRSVLRRGGPLVFGTHTDLSKPIVRAGLQVRTVEVATQVSAARLTQILNRRIDASRVASSPIPRITESHAVRLQLAFGADVRAIEHYLYDQFQRSASEQKPWPPAT
ncbi:MAG: hypothetical protein ACO1RT_07405 [Planctomycetaceae bacterium]